MQLDKVYEPLRFEPHWAQWWIDQGIFRVPEGGEMFSLVIPPPNVTGSLHMGHMLEQIELQLEQIHKPGDKGLCFVRMRIENLLRQRQPRRLPRRILPSEPSVKVRLGNVGFSAPRPYLIRALDGGTGMLPKWFCFVRDEVAQKRLNVAFRSIIRHDPKAEALVVILGDQPSCRQGNWQFGEQSLTKLLDSLITPRGMAIRIQHYANALDSSLFDFGR